MNYWIYEMSDGQRAALYVDGNGILSCLLPFRRGMAPVLVKNDYMSEITSQIFNDTICYVYKNLEHQIVLDTLGVGPPRVLLTDSFLYTSYTDLHLCVKGSELYLFYQTLNLTDNNYYLYVTMPYRDKKTALICKGGKNPLYYQVISTGQKGPFYHGCLLTSVENEGDTQVFDWMEDLIFQKKTQTAGDDYNWQTSHQSLEEENERLTLMLSNLQQEIQSTNLKQEEKMRKLVENETALMTMKKDYEENILQLKNSHKNDLEKCQTFYTEQLTALKKQYNTLAETAIQLQKVAKKWREKYWEKEEAEEHS